jgi:hypothetical protein
MSKGFGESEGNKYHGKYETTDLIVGMKRKIFKVSPLMLKGYLVTFPCTSSRSGRSGTQMWRIALGILN